MALDLEATARFIAKWETFVGFVYDDGYYPPRRYTGGAVKGTLTIGYGETDKAFIARYRESGVTQPVAWIQLRQRILEFNRHMRAQLGPVPLTANQEGAVTSLVYNIGPGNDAKRTGWKYSPVLQALRGGDYGAAAASFSHHNKAGGKVSQGLINRRREEAAWFRSSTPAASPGAPGLPTFEAVRHQFARWDGTAEGPRNNEVVFNDWYYGRKVFGAAYPWCAAYVSYALYHAGMPIPATTSKGFVSTVAGAQWFQKRGRWTRTPAVGS
ncbi:MAG TPA: lysozyme, partial [Actinomycetota bacterium]|nr:lysozyme [Actinomycetota bacterium]